MKKLFWVTFKQGHQQLKGSSYTTTVCKLLFVQQTSQWTDLLDDVFSAIDLKFD